MARPRIRSKKHLSVAAGDLKFYAAGTDNGWRVIRTVTFAYGEDRCRRGEWRRVYDELTGALCGFQALEQKFESTDSGSSRAALGVPEMHALAGLLGRSRTKGMAEMDRVGRRHPLSGRELPAEDFVECAEVLVNQVYLRSANFRGGDKAQRVYPRAVMA